MMISRWMRIGVLSCALLIGGVGVAWAQQTPSADIPSDGCGLRAQEAASTGASLTSSQRRIQPNWTCVIPADARTRSRSCVDYGCTELTAGAYCCPPGTPSRPPGRDQASGGSNTAQQGAAQTPASTPSAPLDCGAINMVSATRVERITADWTCSVPNSSTNGCETFAACTERNAAAKCCPAGTPGTAVVPVNVVPLAEDCGAQNASLPTAQRNATIRPTWRCLTPNVASVPQGACAGEPDPCSSRASGAKCCDPARVQGTFAPAASGSSADASGTSTAASPQYNAGRSGGITLPACARSNDPSVAGNCTLDDLIAVAASFANFLMGLAAAVFLILIVWSGARFVLFAADSGTAGEAKSTLVNATIGMVIVFAASIIVRFVMTATTGSATGRGGSSGITETSCVERQGQGFSCQNTASFSTERKRGCVDNLCPGAAEIKCCPNTANPTAGTPAAGTGTTNAAQPTTPAAASGNNAGTAPTPAR